MYYFFEIIKGLFFFLTVVVGLFFLRGNAIITNPVYYNIIKQFLMPGYLVFCGLILSYVIAHIWIGNQEDSPKHAKIYVKSFIIGIISGIVLASIYIFI